MTSLDAFLAIQWKFTHRIKVNGSLILLLARYEVIYLILLYMVSNMVFQNETSMVTGALVTSVLKQKFIYILIDKDGNDDNCKKEIVP